jgi:undecaprenyl-diphosphatase
MANGLSDGRAPRLDPLSRFSVRVVLLLGAAVLVVVPFATLLFEVVAKGPLVRLDGRVANRLNGWVSGHPLWVSVLKGVSALGGPPFLAALVAVGVAVVWRRGRVRLAVFLVATALGGSLLDSAVKILVDRPRPVVDHAIATARGKSFPSGHSMSSMVVYGALLVVFLPAVQGRGARRAVVAGAAAVILAVGSSRLLLGVHFVSDVAGGFVLGLAWLAGSVALFEAWRVEEGRPPSAPLAEGVEPEAGPALRGD